MKAVALHSYGGPQVLELLDLPEPEPAPGRVIVRVLAATVNPTDTLLRSGKQAAGMAGLEPPFVPGMELAGHVHQVGAGVEGWRIGQPVMAVVNPRRPEGGAQAELVSVPAESLVPAPDSLDLVDAATLPMNGLTALKVVEALREPGGLSAGDTVLVTGGAGALGGYVVQLARHAGLRVVADAHDSDADLLRSLGAESIVPRGPAMSGAVRALRPAGVDAAVDAALLGDAVTELVRDGGPCVSVRGPRGDGDTRVRHHAVSVTQYAEDTGALARLAHAVADRVLTPRVAHRLPPARAAAAHELVERGGLRGRVVLTFDPTS